MPWIIASEDIIITRIFGIPLLWLWFTENTVHDWYIQITKLITNQSLSKNFGEVLVCVWEGGNPYDRYARGYAVAVHKDS